MLCQGSSQVTSTFKHSDLPYSFFISLFYVDCPSYLSKPTKTRKPPLDRSNLASKSTTVQVEENGVASQNKRIVEMIARENEGHQPTYTNRRVTQPSTSSGKSNGPQILPVSGNSS